MTEPITSSVTLTKQQAEDRQHAELFARIAALESELAALRQIAADVETCRQSCDRSTLDSVEIYADSDTDQDGLCATVCVRSALRDEQYHYAPTWQSALHAAAEHVRREGG